MEDSFFIFIVGLMKVYGFIVLDEVDLDKVISGQFKFKKLKFENRRVYKSLNEAWAKTSTKLTTCLKLEFDVTEEEIGAAIRNTAWGIYDPVEFNFNVIETHER